MKQVLLIFLLLPCLLIQAQPAGYPASPDEYLAWHEPAFVGKPPFRRQFLDAMIVEESFNLKRVFHAAKKYEGNPIFMKEKPWEGWGPSLGGSVVKDGDKLRMYYYTLSDGEGTNFCVAESIDGINWTRPIVGDVEFHGSKQNNIIKSSSTHIIKINNPPSPNKKWISFNNFKGLSFSSDGLHWENDPEWDNNILFSSSDVVIWFFDPYNNRMSATWKTFSRRHRAAGVVWSSNLKTWTKPIEGPVIVADDLDPDATQIYGMPVFAYQGMYIGLPWIYHSRWLKHGKYTKPEVMFEAQVGSPCIIDTQIAWSWDLINWTRTADRKPFIATHPYRGVDAGLAFTAANPIVMDDEIWIYYSGWDQIHEDYKGIDCAVGLAKLRLDGFCSMQGGDEEGWFISRREVFNTPKVTVNAKCSQDGYIAAEIVDRYDNPIPGFEKYYCNAFTGDSIRGEITWKNETFPNEWTDKDKKIKFYIKNADIYSYLPENINQDIDNGWPDY